MSASTVNLPAKNMIVYQALSDNVEEVAAQLRGNYLKFTSFAWMRIVDDPENWCIDYTHHRDSDLTAVSNAEAITKIFQPFLNNKDEDITVEYHTHFAYGWVKGYAIRVYRKDWDGKEQDPKIKFTPAFLALCEIKRRLADYPLLDEDDLSNKEFEATLENIEDEGKNLVDTAAEPSDWVGKVYNWLSENNEPAIAVRDGGGGYSKPEDLAEALWNLDILDADYAVKYGYIGE